MLLLDIKKILIVLKLLKGLFNLNNLKTLFDKKLHTNACGDFTMIDKQSFYKMKGYYEFDGFSWHIDSLLLFKAYYYITFKIINMFDSLKMKCYNYLKDNDLIVEIKTQIIKSIDENGNITNTLITSNMSPLDFCSNILDKDIAPLV